MTFKKKATIKRERDANPIELYALYISGSFTSFWDDMYIHFLINWIKKNNFVISLWIIICTCSYNTVLIKAATLKISRNKFRVTKLVQTWLLYPWFILWPVSLHYYILNYIFQLVFTGQMKAISTTQIGMKKNPVIVYWAKQRNVLKCSQTARGMMLHVTKSKALFAWNRVLEFKIF